MREELVSTIIAMISENSEEHAYSVQRLYQAINDDISQQSLSQIATWTIGEFGDLLITGPMEIEGDALDVSVCSRATTWCSPQHTLGMGGLSATFSLK